MPTVTLPNRGTVAYRWTGDGPETVVLVNGSVFNYHQWDRQVLPILRRGLGHVCRFLQYDYVGIGGSSAKTEPIRMLDLADELRDLLDRLLVRRVHLLGISQGSLVSQAFLIRHQGRAKSFCGLGNPNLLSTGLESTLADFRERLEALEKLKPLWPQRIDRHNVAQVLRIYSPAMLGKRYEELSPLDRIRFSLLQRILYPALKGTFIQTMVDLFRYYVEGAAQEAPAFATGLPQVKGVPILLLNGTADTTTPLQMSRELAELLPEAELVEFEGVTHMGPMLVKREARLVLRRYVAFIRQVVG